MTEITPKSTAATPPTPENVAEMLTSGDNDYHDGNYWHPSIGADGNVVHIGITAYSEDGDKLPKVHFRAVVVEGTATPIVLPSGAKPAVVRGDGDYLYLRCSGCNESLVIVESGTSLREQNDAHAAHECPTEAAQAGSGAAR